VNEIYDPSLVADDEQEQEQLQNYEQTPIEGLFMFVYVCLSLFMFVVCFVCWWLYDYFC